MRSGALPEDGEKCPRFIIFLRKFVEVCKNAGDPESCDFLSVLTICQAGGRQKGSEGC